MAPPRILVFDSGLGGMTVFREVAAARPDASYVYVADDAFFPYGNLDDEALTRRVVEVFEGVNAEYGPDLVVIACNTASTVVLPVLRSRFVVPFVGTVPAIKPACAISRSRLVSVLGTEATVQREYTQGLIRNFGQDCEVTLVGSIHLASLAEAAFRGETIDEDLLSREISACFVESHGRRTDVVVMACTHYPLLIEHFEQRSPWPVLWLDPAEAIARRVIDLIGPAAAGAPRGTAKLVFTSGKQAGTALEAAIARLGMPSA